MTKSVRPLISRSVGRSIGLSNKISLKAGKFHFHAPIGLYFLRCSKPFNTLYLGPVVAAVLISRAVGRLPYIFVVQRGCLNVVVCCLEIQTFWFTLVTVISFVRYDSYDSLLCSSEYFLSLYISVCLYVCMYTPTMFMEGYTMIIIFIINRSCPKPVLKGGWW